jgi:hypothetical protein
MSLKNPVTPSRIDPGTFQLVAQCLSHYATPGPSEDRSGICGLRMSGTIPPLPHTPSWNAQALSFTIKCLDSIHILKTLNSSEMLEINCVHTHTRRVHAHRRIHYIQIY